ncbi:hypothetical protein [endosymbiont GvMRE of Glomus versiforme]|uniref:hypothetical protein n=1 Tax=endosymbiont GvMRE of Glomus versiforme TaxID=2039283 RepID=UPI0015590604|nr:hypothetical protein [endosymbiont GvMRE of Glomus versiforme]
MEKTKNCDFWLDKLFKRLLSVEGELPVGINLGIGETRRKGLFGRWWILTTPKLTQ